MTTSTLLIMVAFIISAHLFAALSWERYFSQQEKKNKAMADNEKDGEVVKANAVPMVNI